MSDIKALLREAASGNPQIDISLRNRLEAAAEAMGEPFLTILAPDPFDERSGAYMSMQDLDKLERLPPGTKLYLAPQPAVPEGYVLVPVEPTEAVCEVMEECMRDHGFNPDDIGEFDKAACYKAMLVDTGDSHE